MELTREQRVILTNQYEILARLDPGRAETYRNFIEILENGYESHYDELNVSIAEQNFPESDCSEVIEILSMYRSLHDSLEQLGEQNGITMDDVTFEGFDGNNESAHLGYATFLIHNLGRLEEVLRERPNFHLNSHMQTLPIYRRMLNEWNSNGRKTTLTIEEIDRILAARTHPEFAR